MLKAFKYRIYPSEKQKELLAKTFGCVRYVYNRSLDLKSKAYQDEKKSLSVFTLIKTMATWKRDEESMWLSEVNSQALQSSLRNLDRAFTNFFRKNSDFPKFKKRSGHQSFQNVQQTRVDWDAKKVFIPKFKEGIKIVLHRTFEGELRTSTVSKDKSGRYFISILVEDGTEAPYLPEAREDKTIGIDLGLKHFATFSTGEKIDNPRFLKGGLKKIKRESRKLSRKKKGSANREKNRIRLANAHSKVADCRKDFIHKVTHRLVERQDSTGVAIEDLAVKDMLEEKRFSQSISDVGWGMFRETLTYKCAWYGKNLHVIGRFEPSSRLCVCGYHNRALTLADREWDCPECHRHHDRDLLAANNVRRFAFREQNTRNDSIGKGYPESTPAETSVEEAGSPVLQGGE